MDPMKTEPGAELSDKFSDGTHDINPRRIGRDGLRGSIARQELGRSSPGQWISRQTIAKRVAYSRPWGQRGLGRRVIILACARHRERVANDGLGNEAIRTGREAIAEPKFDIDHADFEIGHGKERMLLLLQRKEIPDLPKVGIVLGADEEILAKLAREPGRRQEIGFATSAKTHVDDGIDDELPILVAPSEDRADFHGVDLLREPRKIVAEFKIHAVEEIAFVRVRNDKQVSNFGPVREQLPIARREWEIKPELPPIENSVGEFRRTIERMVGNEAAGKVRLFAAVERVIEMLLNGPLADLGNVGVVKLDLVGGARGERP